MLKTNIPTICVKGYEHDPSVRPQPIQRRGQGSNKGSKNSSGRGRGRGGRDNKDSLFSENGRQENRPSKSPWGAKRNARKLTKRLKRAGGNKARRFG